MTGDKFDVYTSLMKMRVILILFLFILYIVSFSIHIQIGTSHSEQPIMITLDVCHMADAYSKGGSDIPSITTPTAMLPLPLPSGGLEQRPFTALRAPTFPPEEKPPESLI